MLQRPRSRRPCAPALLLGIALAASACAPTLHLPARPAGAPGGVEIARAIRTLDLDAREERLYAEVARGNVPPALRKLKRIDISRVLDGRSYRVRFWASPDYLAVGSDDDYLLIPLTPQTAQRIADLAGATLPTPLMVDALWSHAQVRLAPAPIPPSDEMTTVPVFEDHNRYVQQQRAARRVPAGTLVAGHKKDVVLTSRLAAAPGKVAIYGWHRSDGRPIQPLYLGHTDRWVDYSHGVRLIHRFVSLDGTRRDVLEVLRDERLAPLLSGEGVLPQPAYRVP